MRWVRRAGMLVLIGGILATAGWAVNHFKGRKASPTVAAPTKEAPPGGAYLFAETPLRAVEIVAELKIPAPSRGTIAPDELALFADVKKGQFNQWTFAEAALLASGVTDRQQRRPYLNKLDALREQAEAKVADAQTPQEKARMLLDFLHSEAGPMKKYQRNQASLSAILDTGNYNCVSSAVLYNVIGRRLGLDLRAVEIPDHVYSILYHDNQHFDIETTTRYGFNPDRKQPIRELEDDADKEDEAKNDADKTPREPREIDEQGLVAVVYYSRGYFHGKARRYHEALLTYFSALCLDPQSPSANHNALAELTNWSLDLCKEDLFTAARDEATLAFLLAPKDKNTHNNMCFAINKGMKQLLDVGKLAEAAAWIDVAIQRCPECAELPKLKHEMILHRSSVLVEARDWPAAAQAFALLSDRQPAKQNLLFLTHHWIKDVNAGEGPDQALKVLTSLLERFPDLADEIRKTGKGAVQNIVIDLVNSEKYEKAVAVGDHGGQLLQDPAAFKKNMIYAYDMWGRKLVEQKDWQTAVDLYARALKQYPGEESLSNSAAFAWFKWAESYQKNKDWTAAIRIYEKALERFPEDKIFKSNLDYCKAELKRTS